MMKSGQIPNTLLAAAASAVGEQASPDYAKTAELIEFITIVAFVEPKVVQGVAADGELSIDDVSDADKTFIMTWSQQEARALEPFRGERPGTPSGVDGGDVRREAELSAVR